VQESANHLDERLDDETKASHGKKCAEEQNGDDGQQTRDDEAPPIESMSFREKLHFRLYLPRESRIRFVHDNHGSDNGEDQSGTIPAIRDGWILWVD
jgi:hypothetical protein